MKLRTFLIFELLFGVVFCSVLNRTDRAADLSDLLDDISRNLDNVVDASSLSEKSKRSAKAGLEPVLSRSNRRKLAQSEPEVDALLEKLHMASHDVVDNLGLPVGEHKEIQSLIHHVFSAASSPSHCYEYISPNHTGCLDEPGCTPLSSTDCVSEEDKLLIVEVHNSIRSEVALGTSLDEGAGFTDLFGSYHPQASRMREMVSQPNISEAIQLLIYLSTLSHICINSVASIKKEKYSSKHECLS
jgi:hypothetical protein